MAINISLSIILLVLCVSAVGTLAWWLAGRLGVKPWGQIFLMLFFAFLVLLIVKIS